MASCWDGCAEAWALGFLWLNQFWDQMLVVGGRGHPGPLSDGSSPLMRKPLVTDCRSGAWGPASVALATRMPLSGCRIVYTVMLFMGCLASSAAEETHCSAAKRRRGAGREAGSRGFVRKASVGQCDGPAQ